MALLSASQRFRSIRDYATFVFKHQTTANKAFLGLDSLMLVVGTTGLTLATDGASLALIWPGARFLYGLAKLPRTMKAFRHATTLRQVKRSSLVAGGRTVSLTAVVPSDRQRALGFEPQLLGKDPVIRSLAVDQALGKHDWQCCISSSHAARVHRAITGRRDFCLAFLTRQFESARGKSLFVNDPKWSLAQELNPASASVDVHGGGYFDSFCTNEACTSVLVDSDGDERSGLGLFPVAFGTDGVAHLDDLEFAPVNNHVGISTLAVTADRYIVIWQQGDLNIVDPGKIVPTGSGSGDLGDLDCASLRSTVTRGMERELREEGLRNGVQLPPNAVASTELLGFFRWLSRGGKPEFVGLTRLNLNVGDVWPDHREVFDPTKAKTKRKLDNRYSVGDLKSLPDVIARIRDLEAGRKATLSLPLKVILTRLEEMLGQEPVRLERALFGESTATPAPS